MRWPVKASVMVCIRSAICVCSSRLERRILRLKIDDGNHAHRQHDDVTAASTCGCCQNKKASTPTSVTGSRTMTEVAFAQNVLQRAGVVHDARDELAGGVFAVKAGGQIQQMREQFRRASRRRRGWPPIAGNRRSSNPLCPSAAKSAGSGRSISPPRYDARASRCSSRHARHKTRFATNAGKYFIGRLASSPLAAGNTAP